MLEAITALWTGNGDVTYAGRHIAFEQVAAIHPQQTPHPPIWVGGNSESALRRAVRYGTAWHSINQSIGMLRDRWLPALRAEAERAGKPTPTFAPRIRLHITAEANFDAARVPGSGSLAQVHDDLGGLEALGAEYVVLNWYTGDLDATREHERGFAMLATVADRVVELGRVRVR